jgi:hypothetical protein
LLPVTSSFIDKHCHKKSFQGAIMHEPTPMLRETNSKGTKFQNLSPHSCGIQAYNPLSAIPKPEKALKTESLPVYYYII